MTNDKAILVLLALGNESRLNVFRLIVQRGDVGLTPKEIIELLGIANATLSYQLKELLQANVISVERQGRRLLYRPNAQLVQNLTEFLLNNCCNGKSCIPHQPTKKVASS